MVKLGRIKGLVRVSMSIIREILILENGTIINSLKVLSILYFRYYLSYIKVSMSLRMVSLTRDKLIMAKLDMVTIGMPTATYIRDSGKMTLSKVTELCIILIKIHMKVNGSKAKRMDMELTIIITVLFIKATLLMVEKMVWAR